MSISFDPSKRAKTLEERGLDFQDALEAFKGVTVEVNDERKDYMVNAAYFALGFLAGA